MRTKKDITGQKFGKLTALQISHSCNGTYWLCKCDCGNTKKVLISNLTTGKIKSCGCAYIDMGEKFRKYNPYIIKGDYVELKTFNTGNNFYIDLEDLDKVKKMCWFESRQGYIINRSYRKTIHLHRLVTNCPNGKVVDHIDHNPLNNRKINLRVCTQKENMHNRNMMAKNKIGQFGICEIRRNDRKYYIIQIYGEYYGCFKELNKAVIRRNEIIKEHTIQ